jgi:hypothetical protein
MKNRNVWGIILGFACFVSAGCFHGSSKSAKDAAVWNTQELPVLADKSELSSEKPEGYVVAENTFYLNAGKWNKIRLIVWKVKLGGEAEIAAIYDYMLNPQVAKNLGHGLTYVKDEETFEIRLDSNDKLLVVVKINPMTGEDDFIYNCYDAESEGICKSEAKEMKRWKNIIKWHQRISQILEKTKAGNH